jgi:hypothetical protein
LASVSPHGLQEDTDLRAPLSLEPYAPRRRQSSRGGLGLRREFSAGCETAHRWPGCGRDFRAGGGWSAADLRRWLDGRWTPQQAGLGRRHLRLVVSEADNAQEGNETGEQR